jgi:hypothetical protein
MNDETIEKLLRKAPGVVVPEGLRDRLQAQIALPNPEPRSTRRYDTRPWLRRWMPALSFAAFFVACVVAIGVQTNVLTDLKRENESLRASVQNLPQLQNENAEFKRLQTQTGELERLRNDNLELQKLRSEAGRLQAQSAEVERLRVENHKLQAANSAGAGTLPGKPAGDFFAREQARAERIKCVNNLKQIGLAARIWALDHNDIFPSDFISITNELANTLDILKCPTDKNRTISTWAEVAAGNVSYQMLTPGIREDENPQTVAVVCPIHHNILLLDGSVQQMSEERMQQNIQVINGRKVFVP